MSAYIDKIREHPNAPPLNQRDFGVNANRKPILRYCRCWADTEAELHAFAGALGLRRKLFRQSPFPHCPLTHRLRWEALRAGAVAVERHPSEEDQCN